MSVEVMRTVIEAAEGRVPVDTLFTNAQIVDVYGQRVAPGSVAVKDGVIVGVLYDGRDDAAGTYEATEVIDCQVAISLPVLLMGICISSLRTSVPPSMLAWPRRAVLPPPLPTATRLPMLPVSTACAL